MNTLRQLVVGQVRAEMARQRKTGVQLADLLHCSQQTASRLLTGSGRSFDLDEIEAIAAWLDISPLDLVPWPAPEMKAAG